jgi:hypothetical protein
MSCPKIHNVELHPKARKIEFPAGNTEAGSAMEALSNQHSAVSENQHQNPSPLTTGDTESTEKSKVTTQQQVHGLAHKLAKTYEELSRLLERNPAMKRQMTEGDAREEKIYQRLKQRLKMADMAPRCQWVKQGGTACRSPQMKQHIYCFAHKQMAEARELMLMIPVVEDANAIQVGLMRIQKALIEDTISMKKAGLLLYSMQLAMTNVGQTTFGQAKDEEMVRETVDEDEAFREKVVSNQHSAFTENQTPTTETQRHGEEPGEEKNLPINADERGLENRSQFSGSLRRICTGWTRQKGGRLTRRACGAVASEGLRSRSSHPSPRKSGAARGPRSSHKKNALKCAIHRCAMNVCIKARASRAKR